MWKEMCLRPELGVPRSRRHKPGKVYLAYIPRMLNTDRQTDRLLLPLPLGSEIHSPGELWWVSYLRVPRGPVFSRGHCHLGTHGSS